MSSAISKSFCIDLSIIERDMVWYKGMDQKMPLHVGLWPKGHIVTLKFMVADVLATQGAQASATMIMTMLNRNNSVSAH